ncbi:MAG TPA: AlpA family phage regulatory protein [Burkholderiales bacterium]|nr:AlpA family phage regulatory protein [Burkholderiales bacterium]
MSQQQKVDPRHRAARSKQSKSKPAPLVPPLVVRARDLPAIVGVSRWSATRWSDFPQPISLGGSAIGWRFADIQAWLAKRPLANGRLRGER